MSIWLINETLTNTITLGQSKLIAMKGFSTFLKVPGVEPHH